jgi:hypothetical protein
MFKVPDPCKYHGHPVCIAVIDRFLVTDRPAGLDHSCYSCFTCYFNTVGKREECIRCHDRILQVKLKVQRLFDALCKGVDP